MRRARGKKLCRRDRGTRASPSLSADWARIGLDGTAGCTANGGMFVEESHRGLHARRIAMHFLRKVSAEAALQAPGRNLHGTDAFKTRGAAVPPIFFENYVPARARKLLFPSFGATQTSYIFCFEVTNCFSPVGETTTSHTLRSRSLDSAIARLKSRDSSFERRARTRRMSLSSGSCIRVGSHQVFWCANFRTTKSLDFALLYDGPAYFIVREVLEVPRDQRRHGVCSGNGNVFRIGPCLLGNVTSADETGAQGANRCNCRAALNLRHPATLREGGSAAGPTTTICRRN